jgi:hypothetical protein
MTKIFIEKLISVISIYIHLIIQTERTIKEEFAKIKLLNFDYS